MPTRSVIPDCLYRNCIEFMIPCVDTPCTVMLIDTLLQFEVHVNVCSTRAASKLCPIIRGAISAGLRKANLTLGYTNSTPSFALLCPCGNGNPHPATIGDGSWICSLNVGVGKEFVPNQIFWSTEDSKEQIDQGRMESSNSTCGDGNAGKRKLRSDHGNNGQSAGATLYEGAAVASVEIAIQDVAARAGIDRLDILDQECSQQVLLCLARHCVDWKLIGRHLKLTEADIAAVDEDNRKTEQKRVGMLEKWKEKFAFKATNRAFIEALLSHGRASDAVEACKAIMLGEAPIEKQTMFKSSMSEEEFFKWLKTRGISEKDCRTLSESGITPSGFDQLDAEDFDDLELTKIGKKLILKALAKH